MGTYTIKDISEMFQIPASTLRYYEEVGILTQIGRTSTGQRIYTDRHVRRLRTILCFKGTGMTIAQLRSFFQYETNEKEHIDDILSLLEQQKTCVAEQLIQLQRDYEHVQRKLHYYWDMKSAMESGSPLPVWADYRKKRYEEETSQAVRGEK